MRPPTSFLTYKLREKSSIIEHVLRLSEYYNHLIQLGVNLPDDSVIDRILQSLPPGYKSFVMNYNMQGMDKTIPELFRNAKGCGGRNQEGASSVDGQQDLQFQDKG